VALVVAHLDVAVDGLGTPMTWMPSPTIVLGQEGGIVLESSPPTITRASRPRSWHVLRESSTFCLEVDLGAAGLDHG